MSAPAEVIARRLAERFAPELGDRLPAFTERALAGQRSEETTFRSVEPALILAYAGFMVSAASTAWAIYLGLWQKGQAEQREAALTADVAALQREMAFVKGLLLADLRDQAPRIPVLTEPVRERLLEAAADEALAHAAWHPPR